MMMAAAAPTYTIGPTTTADERAKAASMREGAGMFNSARCLCTNSPTFIFFSAFSYQTFLSTTGGDGDAGKAYVDGMQAVEIDEGTFKYVLIEAMGTAGVRR